MIKGIIRGVKSVSSIELGKEIALAVVAGAVSWYVTEKLMEYKKNKNK